MASFPDYTTDGTENLRANAKVLDATTSAAYEKDERAGSGGKDAGGDATNAKILSDAGNRMPTSYNHDVPPGLQSFDDNGQKDGGTKYIGR